MSYSYRVYFLKMDLFSERDILNAACIASEYICCTLIVSCCFSCLSCICTLICFGSAGGTKYDARSR